MDAATAEVRALVGDAGAFAVDETIDAMAAGDAPALDRGYRRLLSSGTPGFVVTALAPDGVIEAIESPDSRFALGVQFHPEEMWSVSERLARLFRAFVQECAST